MSKIVSNKVHTKIGAGRSICGLNPQHGDYHIASFSSFFTAKPENQCARCIEGLQRRGYNITKSREQYRTLYDQAEAQGFPAHILPPAPRSRMSFEVLEEGATA